MFALVFGFTVLGVPLIVLVALNPTTVVVVAAFAVQLAACLIGVVWVLKAFSDDDRSDEPQPDEHDPEIVLRPSGRPLGSGERAALVNRRRRSEAGSRPAQAPAAPLATPAAAGVIQSSPQAMKPRDVSR